MSCSVSLSYISPLGEIETVVYNHVSPNKLSLIKKIINSNEKVIIKANF